MARAAVHRHTQKNAEPKRTIPLEYIYRVFRYLRPHWRLALASVVITVLSTLVNLLAPWPLKILIDNVLGQRPLSSRLTSILGPVAHNRSWLLTLAVSGGLIIAILVNGLHVMTNYVNTQITQWITLDFRSYLFLHAQRMSLAFHDRRQSGMIIYMINSQGGAPAGLIMTAPMVAESGLTLIGMIWICYQIDSTLALSSLSVVPFLYYSVGFYATHIQERLGKVRAMEAESLAVIHESISMMRVIVAFGREGHEYRRFRDQTTNAVEARVQVTIRQTLFSLVINMITAISSTVVLGISAQRVIQGQMTVGQLLVVIAYIAAIYKPLETISFTIGSLQDLFISLRSTFELLDTQPDTQDAPGAKEYGRIAGGIVFEGVHFTYSGRNDTLADISFSAKPGQVISIVGPTGSGKSTVA
ncbi:MAG: ABC transporter ATP-binding protein [Pedosphaera sp.]|nr:ABC transporter ATP-binding protein [Pedosphaera sp.]